MAKSKLKKKSREVAISSTLPRSNEGENKIPIPNLPEKFLWMKVSHLKVA